MILTFQSVYKLFRFFHMKFYFLVNLKTVRIFPDDCQLSEQIPSRRSQNCLGFFQMISYFPVDRQSITHSLAMSRGANMRFLGLDWEMASRALFGKFLPIKSRLPESFGFLCLCSIWKKTLLIIFPKERTEFFESDDIVQLTPTLVCAHGS